MNLHQLPRAALATILFLPGLRAEVTLTGSPEEIQDFVEDSLGSRFSVTVTAEEKLEAASAKIEIVVNTENSKLARALQENQEKLEELKKFLAENGIDADRVSAENFSSTPDYGWFSGKPSSYRISTRLEVTIRDRAEFLIVARAVDAEEAIQFIRILPEWEGEAIAVEKAEEAALANLRLKVQRLEAHLDTRLRLDELSIDVVRKAPSAPQPHIDKGGRTTFSSSAPLPESGPLLQLGSSLLTCRISATYRIEDGQVAKNYP